MQHFPNRVDMLQLHNNYIHYEPSRGGVFPGELTSQKLERPPGISSKVFFLVTSLTVHTVVRTHLIFDFRFTKSKYDT
jgi:hypothetical protein